MTRLTVRTSELMAFGTPATVRVSYDVDPDGGYLYEWAPTRVIRDYPGQDVLEIERVDADGHPFAMRVRREDVVCGGVWAESSGSSEDGER